MEELHENKPHPVFDVVSNGDTLLVVGPEMSHIRVHSIFLQSVSKPFSVMFGPVWKEGSSMIDQDNSRKISLPEDNAAAMALVCAVSHHQSQRVPEVLSASDVLELAIAADKYDCVNALAFASTNWLRPETSIISDLMLLASAAYILNNARAFKQITKRMILKHDGSYHSVCSEMLQSEVHWKISCKLINVN